ANPLAFYKLYSSDQMVVSGGAFPFDPLASDFNSDWRNRPAIWTDLNAPTLWSGAAEFPIVEGNGIRLLTRNAAGETVTGYYGYDMDGNGLPDVDGFSVDPSAVGYDPSQALSVTNTPVPMPVRWIYVLNDGSLTVPDDEADGGRTARWTGSGGQPVPSAENPITGRIAFWADDETSKLNLNTASEGGYWDPPRFSSAADLAMGRSGPAQREYNRYPGHPAGVSLSPVLGAALGLPQPTRFSLQSVVSQAPVGSPATADPKPILATGVDAYLERLFSITPRFLWGGSKMGTRATAASITGAAGIAKADLQLDRLYASVDEALYAPPAVGDATRPLNPPARTPSLTPGFLNLARFFLTTSSRSPDVNPFNQPKIAMWPIDDLTRANPLNDQAGGLADSRSPLDKTIAFCSTINGYPNYFTRNNPMDPAGDFTPRNAQIYDYLVNRLSDPLPGYGASFASRYPGKQTPQIVTSIYDFIRGAINISDSTAEGANRSAYSFSKPFLDNPGEPDSHKLARPGVGQVAPFNHPSNDTKGTGRFPTIQQAVILFIATAANQPPLQVDPVTGRPIGAPTEPAANPLHPYPNRVPTPAQILSAGSPAIFTINDAASEKYPTRSNQTHPGLRYLTDQNPATGAYDQPNPTYAGPALNYGQTQIQAILFFPMANPAAGNPALSAHYKLRVSGAGVFGVNGVSLNMRNGTKEVRGDQPLRSEVTTSGVVGFLGQIMGRQEGSSPSDLVFYSDKITVANSTAPGSDTFAFIVGEITVE
ncbi:MAG: Verru_Chthon cassette protein A, partial [Terrimicrobiaceae bacterium]